MESSDEESSRLITRLSSALAGLGISLTVAEMEGELLVVGIRSTLAEF